LTEQKEALLEMLAPQAFLNVKTALGKLERQLAEEATPELDWICIRFRGHEHTDAEIAAAARRLWEQHGGIPILLVGEGEKGNHCQPWRGLETVPWRGN